MTTTTTKPTDGQEGGMAALPRDAGTRSLWVLGHRVTVLPVGGRIAALEVATPPGVPGPPPHWHEDADELFYVTSGRLGVMRGNDWTTLEPGDHAIVPRGVLHTFRNEGSDEAKTITAFEPQGFEGFFLEFGVDVGEEAAFERSVSDDMIARVVAGCARFGMIVPQA